MAQPYFRRLQIFGLKGGPVDLELGRKTTVAGPNGAGKTRVGEAIAFLLGRPVAGLEIGANAMRDLLHGPEIRVVGTLDTGGADVLITRMRQLSGSTFRKPVLLVDGERVEDGVLFELLGGHGDLPGGRDLISMSEAKLVAAVAGIAASGEAVDTLQERLDEAGIEIGPSDGTPTGRLDAMAKAAKEAAKVATRERRAVEKGADLSRQELGERFDPAEVPRLKRERDGARSALGEAQRAHGEARARVEAHDERVAGIRAELSRIDAQLSDAADAPAGPTPDQIAEADSTLTEAEAKLAADQEAERSAWSASSAADRAAAQARSALADKRRAIEADERAVADHRRRAELITRAPCSGCESWQPEDPFEDEVDLAGTCELLANARQSRDAADRIESGRAAKEAEVSGLEQALRTAEAEAEAARSAADTAAATVRASRARCDETSSTLRELQSAAQRAAQAGDAGSLRARRGELDLEVTGLDALRDELVEAAGARQTEVASAQQALTEADEALRASEQAAERFRRLQADRQRLSDAEKVEQDAKALVAEVEEVQRGFIDEGVGMLRAAGGRYLPGLTIDISGGALGVRDPEGVFWSGAGLSAAQRTMLELALDRAFEVIAGRTYPLVILEADPIDEPNLASLIEAIDRDVGSGEVAQALVIAWRPIQSDGWTQVAFEAPPEVEADPWDDEDDPWDDEDDRVPIPELLEGLTGPQLKRIWNDPEMPEVSCWPDKMPRALAKRRETLTQVFSAIGYDAAAAAIERAKS